jgi:hypothetical protein
MYKEENSDGAFILLNLLRTYYLILTSFSIVRAMKITKKKKCKTKENIHIRLFFASDLFSSAAVVVECLLSKIRSQGRRRAQYFIDKSEGNVCHKSLMHKKIENSIEEEKKLIRLFIMQ